MQHFYSLLLQLLTAGSRLINGTAGHLCVPGTYYHPPPFPTLLPGEFDRVLVKFSSTLLSYADCYPGKGKLLIIFTRARARLF